MTTAAKASGVTPSTASAHTLSTPHMNTFDGSNEPASVEAHTTSSLPNPEPITSAVPGFRPSVPSPLEGPTSTNTQSMMEDTTTLIEDESSSPQHQPTPTSTSSVPQPGPTAFTSGGIQETTAGSHPAPPQSSTDTSILNQTPTTQTSQVQPTRTAASMTTPSSSTYMPPQSYYSPPEPTFRGQPTSATSASTESPYSNQPRLYTQQQQQTPYTSAMEGNTGYYQQQTNTSRPMDYGIGGGGNGEDSEKKDSGILGKITQVVDSVNQWMVGDHSGKGPSA